MPALHLAQDAAADELLSHDPLALLIGMLLDQQFPMERAFYGPYLLASRLGGARLDASRIAGEDADRLVAVFTGPPAIHRYPGSMAQRAQALCRLVAEKYDGDAEQIWRAATDGRELLRRLQELPGFGKQKAQIFVALLGKQLRVTPEGWREVAGDYGREGTTMSVADVVDATSLQAVRAYKQERKRAAAST